MSRIKKALQGIVEGKKISGVGKVSKNNATGDKPIDLAFIEFDKNDRKVAITPNSKLVGYKKIKDIKVGDQVKFEAEDKGRGFEALRVEKK